LTLILLVLVTKALTHVLPAGLAHEIDDESEAFPIALLFCAYVQYVRRPQQTAGRSLWPVAAGVAVASWIVAWLLLTLSLPSSVATLNESFVAVGAMVLYACLPRPLPWAPALTVVAVVLLIALQSTHFVTAQAESLVPIALLPISFDWADRTILERHVTDTPGRRAFWCLMLVLVPLVSRAHIDIGSTTDVLHYTRRATEGFLGLLLIHLYFSYWLGPLWRGGRESIGNERPTAVVVPGSET
jgi:hypothetical protein